MKLYDHQQKIVDADPKKCGLFMGTGSGKTRTALFLARGRTLIIAPKTQVEDKNWQREAVIIKSDRTHFEEVYVISKETFRRDHTMFPKFDTVIVDEAHTMLGVTPNTRYRNRVEIPKASQLFEALDEYVARTKPERIYLCTATIMKSPMTVWAAAQILGETHTLKDFLEFRHKFYTKLPMPGREVWTTKKDKLTKDALVAFVKNKGFIGRIEDYMDMPEQVFTTDFVKLTDEQNKRIKELSIEFPDPLVRSLKRHMVENGVLSGDEFNDGEFFRNEKISKIIEYADEFPRLIIFARYKAQIELIAISLKKEGKNVFTLTGETKNRGEILSRLKKADEYIFICQSQISAGWELPDCSVIIFASLDFSLVNLVQAQGRIHRINNLKSNLYIYLTIKDGIDEHIYKSVVETKMDFHLAQFSDI